MATKANNTNKKNSKYKIFQDIDLARNDLYNVTKIQGNQFPEDGINNDLIITTWDSKESDSEASIKSANVLIRAGKGKEEDFSKDGYVHIYAGSDVEPLSSNSGNPLADDFNGIRLNPDASLDSRFKNTRIVSDVKTTASYNEVDVVTTGKVTIATNSNRDPQDKVFINTNNPVEVVAAEQARLDFKKPVTVLMEEEAPVDITAKNAITINTIKQADPETGEVLPVTLRISNPINFTGADIINIRTEEDVNVTTLKKITAQVAGNSEFNLSAPTEIKSSNDFSFVSSTNSGKLTVRTTADSQETVIDLKAAVDLDIDNDIVANITGNNKTATINISNASNEITIDSPVALKNNAALEHITSANVNIKGQQTVSGDLKIPYEVKIENGKATLATSNLDVNDSIRFGKVATKDTDNLRNGLNFIPVSGTSSILDIRAGNIIDIQSSKDLEQGATEAPRGNRANALVNLKNYNLRLQNPSVDADISQGKSKLYIENIEAKERVFVNDTDIHGNIRIGEFADNNSFPTATNAAAEPTLRNNSKIVAAVATVSETENSRTVITNVENIENHRGISRITTVDAVETHTEYHLTGDLDSSKLNSNHLIVETRSAREPDHIAKENTRSYVQTDVLRTTDDFYANNFHIYWDNSINSLVFAYVDSSKLG